MSIGIVAAIVTLDDITKGVNLMLILEMLFIGVVTSSILFLYGLALYNIYLILVYRACRGSNLKPMVFYASDELPNVTIQLPVHNEGNFASQILTLAAGLDYPNDKMQIQYIDDADDGYTSALAMETITDLELKYPAIDFQLLRRENRDGFKAGALAHASKSSSGEFVAIFDADFVIPKNFLKETIHHFRNKDVGAVQARWDYVNCDDKIFTRLQANKLDAHQMFEQTGRACIGKPVIFHGTAGVWRASTLDEIGGWQSCLTEVEDIELSIKAYSSGWKFVYLDHLRVKSELPETVSGFLTQQMRWRRGGGRVVRLLTTEILRGRIDWKIKLDLLLRVQGAWGPVAALLMTIAVLPYISVLGKYGLILPAVFLYSFGLVVAFVTRHLEGKSLSEDPLARPHLPIHPMVRFLPLNYLLFTMGTLWPLVQATVEGLLGGARQWEVTPKKGSSSKLDEPSASKGDYRLLPSYTYGTLFLAFLGLILAIISFIVWNPLACLFYGMMSAGCMYIGLNMLWENGYRFGILNKFMIQ